MKTEKELFDFLAGCIKNFMVKQNMDMKKEHRVGFTFSFPMKKESVASGVLLSWTKGFSAKGVVGKDVVKLLNAALARNGLHNTKVVAIANDTVSTFVARSYEDSACDVGVILGTGTNACYCEKDMLINMEWGNFNKLMQTPYDKKLDRLSRNPGRQLMEKMVSGMYLGELIRIVVEDLISKKVIFMGCRARFFNKPKGLKSEYASITEGDTTKNLSRINRLLKKLGIPNSTMSDRALLRKVCATVSMRAARISAAAMIAVVTKIDPRLSRKHTIAIDGSVYEKQWGFSKNIRATHEEILGKKAKKIKLSLTKDGSGRGAAIIAATA